MKAFHNKYAIWLGKNFGYILIYTSSKQADSVQKSIGMHSKPSRMHMHTQNFTF